MNRQPMTLKGLQERKTTATFMGGGNVLPHKLHMRLCALEMERHRRDQERRVALERARKCHERCEAIETEVRAILEVIQNRAPLPELKPRPARGARTTAATNPSIRPAGILKHRY
jgi:hypothetical protein